MKTETRQTKVRIQDSVADALEWLKSEYSKGVELIYIDYRDQYEDIAQLQSVLKGTDDTFYDDDGSYETISTIIREYSESGDGEAFELSEEVQEAMREWLQNNDTSNPVRDLLKNTGDQLFYIETEDYTNEGSDPAQLKELIKKYAKTPAQKKEIAYVLNNQFYGAPVSFYFYASPLDVFEVIHQKKSKYITITGAYFTTIDRVQGSNWIGENAVFNLTIPREDFIKNFYCDKAKGNGYSWDSIAGQTGFDEASIGTDSIIQKDTISLKPETSEAQKREQRLQENWDKTKKCTFGDMNWNRHTGRKEYSNNYPCGNTCEDCKTFWID